MRAVAWRQATGSAAVMRTGAMTEAVGGPYPGPRPFQKADCNRFFGRAADARNLAGLWQENRLTVALGSAASGKTSLLHAGVLPLMLGRHLDVLAPGQITSGSTAHFAALPKHNPYTLALLRSWSPGETITRLVGLSVHDFIRRRAERHDAKIMVAIDQAEELIIDPGPRWTYRQPFLNELAAALQNEPRMHLLLLVREHETSNLPDELGSHARVRLSPLDSDAALEAITGPITGTGRSYEPGAAEKLISDLRGRRIDPATGGERHAVEDHVQPVLLQIACARLWESLPPDTTAITARDIDRYGNVDEALASHCGQVIATVANYHELPVAQLRAWLIDKFVTEHGTRGTQYEGVTDTAGMPNAVVRALEDRHLLCGQWRSGSRWYELLCDRLIEPVRQASDERMVSAGPADYLRAAEDALTRGELDTAERYAAETLRISPEGDYRLRAEAGSLLGNLAHEREKPAEAEARYRDAASLFEAAGDTEAAAEHLAAVGQVLLAQGRTAAAVGELRAAVGRMPNNSIMQVKLARALWELGGHVAAVAVLTAVLSVDGGNADALAIRGEILASMGAAQEAILDLDRVPLSSHPVARAARALALAETGDYASANKEAEAALIAAPRSGPVLLYAARTVLRAGDQAAATDLIRRALGAADPALPAQQRAAASQLLANRDGV